MINGTLVIVVITSKVMKFISILPFGKHQRSFPRVQVLKEYYLREGDVVSGLPLQEHYSVKRIVLVK